ncbi:MAG: Flp family type IVb pilin [Gaiellaceae bacterium]
MPLHTNPSDRNTQSQYTAGPDGGRPHIPKEVNYTMTITQWFDFVRRSLRKEEGQTMAEYGVVLAVVCVLTVAAFTALHTGIAGALTSVVSSL